MPQDIVIEKFANRTAPQKKINAGLAPYTGTWTKLQAAHLLRRTIFGPTKKQIDDFYNLERSAAVAKVLNIDTTPPSPPVTTDDREPDFAVGETWVTATSGTATYRKNSLRQWWVGELLNSDDTIREKMVLFWHNHFAMEIDVTQRPEFYYNFLKNIRTKALGNFKNLVEEVTIDPTMLRYLNGNTNRNTAPNENYARELMELFTIGKGPQLGEGNYTTYTEADVQEAARVLTGWRDDRSTLSSYYTEKHHDLGDKTFSSALGNTVIKNNGENEYKDLIVMIFNQEATSKFLIRKLYRYFVYYEIDATTETNIIEPLAKIFRDNNFEVKPVLETLLNSQHFYHTDNIGGLIKNPVDLVIGIAKQLNMNLTASDDVVQQYLIWAYFHYKTREQGMELTMPPNVAGWPAYYQSPQYHELWISSATLPLKANYFNVLTWRKGINRGGIYYKPDFLEYITTMTNPAEPNVLISDITSCLLAYPISEEQKTDLKEVLIPGLPDFEWTVEYGKYLNDPTDETIKTAVENKLRNLMRAIFSMAEFQVS